jgi:hypothetical protein
MNFLFLALGITAGYLMCAIQVSDEMQLLNVLDSKLVYCEYDGKECEIIIQPKVK